MGRPVGSESGRRRRAPRRAEPARGAREMPGKEAFWNISRSISTSVAGAVLLVSACRNIGPQTGSETNFLTSCDASCGDGLACICGVCTQACSVADECAALASGAECGAVGDRPVEAACAAAESAAFCDLTCSGDADCEPLGAPFRCQGGFCRAPAEGDTAAVCPVITLAPGDNERTVTVGDTTRSYVVRLPASYTGGSAMPLVLDFHTLGGTPTAEAEASGYRELAEAAFAAVSA
ncbi:hypothetical protein [Sorangium sp. So ce1151]|uniref:hypothetical protein n=1 Tax=Sorangium sp. So ce1151 TaxID=3133332 RepID=UPI003F6146D6